MTFLAPAFLALLALAVPVVLLFFLRRRRDPLEVSTTFLWQEALREERVSPLLHRLERNLLLLLQVAAVLLIAAAAADLVLTLASGTGSRRVVLLVDRSASMAARDAAGARRIDRARERAGVLLDSLRRGDRAMLVAFDSEVRILSGFTGDRRALRAALSALEPTDRTTDVLPALRAAAAAGGEDAEVFLFSDGAFPALSALPQGLPASAVRFIPTGGGGPAAGISGLELLTGLDLPPRLLLRLANTGGEPAPRTVSLRREETVLAAEEVRIPPGADIGITFDLASVPPGPCEAVLEPGDVQPADDRAFFVLREEPTRRVLVVTRGNPVLERLRDLHPRVEVYVVPPEAFAAADPASFDLLVLDREVPAGPLPPVPALFVGCVPPDRGLALGEPGGNPDVVDHDRAHPLNRDVDWADVLFARAAPVLAAGPGALRPVLETAAGPIIAETVAVPRAVVLGFLLADTNLTLRVAWPVFVANLLDRASTRFAAPCVAAGGLLSCPLPPGAGTATVTGPAGLAATLAALPDGTVVLSDTARAGFYRFSFDRGPDHLAAVSLCSPVETFLPPAEAILLGTERRPGEPRAVEASLPARPWLLPAALLVLAAEFLLWAVRRRR